MLKGFSTFNVILILSRPESISIFRSYEYSTVDKRLVGGIKPIKRNVELFFKLVSDDIRVSVDIRIFCNVALVPNLANNTLFIMILCEILGVLLQRSEPPMKMRS